MASEAALTLANLYATNRADRNALQAGIDAAIKAAVLKEREACAVIAETQNMKPISEYWAARQADHDERIVFSNADAIAESIRQRSCNET